MAHTIIVIMTHIFSSDVEQDSGAQPAGAADPVSGSPVGRPRATDIEARNERLLDKAACLFLQNGYSKVSLESIAREAHVAVRTIYVKFGGKAGLFNAILTRNKERYFSTMADMETDMRPVDQILADFGFRMAELISKPEATRLHRMVLAEAGSNPELATTFYQFGPGQARDVVTRFMSRSDIRPLFRPAFAPGQLAIHLLNCIMGDQMSRLLFPPETAPTSEEIRAKVALGLELFFNGTRCVTK